MSFQSATPEGPSNTKTDIWLTPPDIIEKLGGPFDLDPCGWLPDGNPIVKTANKYFTEKDNGLTQDWNYRDIFVNFPYSEAYDWMKKVVKEHRKWNCNINVLCFCRCETRWFQDHVKYATGINMIKRRISFLNEKGEKRTNGNAPSIIISYGDRAYKRAKGIEGIHTYLDRS